MKALALRRHGLREMQRMLRRRFGAFLLAVLLSAAAFTVPLIAGFLAASLASPLSALDLGPEMTAFLAPATMPSEARQLQARLAARPDVSRVEWVGRDAALKSLAQRTGNSALGELKSNPLSDALVVTLAAESSPEAFDELVDGLRATPPVEAVVADTGWHRKLRALLRAGRTIGVGVAVFFAGLLGLIVVASVQLQLATARHEIRVLQMIGADAAFIVRPFAYAGAVTLACAAILAGATAAIGWSVLAPQVRELTALYGITMVSPSLPGVWLAAMTATAAAVGGIVASLAACWSLRRGPLG